MPLHFRSLLLHLPRAPVFLQVWPRDPASSHDGGAGPVHADSWAPSRPEMTDSLGWGLVLPKLPGESEQARVSHGRDAAVPRGQGRAPLSAEGDLSRRDEARLFLEFGFPRLLAIPAGSRQALRQRDPGGLFSFSTQGDKGGALCLQAQAPPPVTRCSCGRGFKSFLSLNCRATPEPVLSPEKRAHGHSPQRCVLKTGVVTGKASSAVLALAGFTVNGRPWGFHS